MKSLIATACILASLFASSTASASKPVPVPVLLTLDTELDGDVAALKTLGIDVPATYFITGKFAVAYPELVGKLAAAGNTIGSHSHAHPHLPALSQDSLENEIRISKTILESVTKKPVVWFRSPYMEYDNRAMKALKAQGFLYDSSDSEHWEEQSVLAELPISDIRRGAMLASDYDLIIEQHMKENEFEDALKELYRTKSILGQPAVILLHPKNAAIYPKALQNFIGFVKNEGGRFVTADQYVAEMQAHKPSRYALWVDFSEAGMPSPEYIAANLARTSVTDVFLMAKDAEGTFYYGPKSVDDVFGRTLALLRKQGLKIKVHAWLPALSDGRALKKHHSWAMTAQNGRLSANWMSPANPEVAAYMKSTVTDIIRNYGVDGIHLDRLSYPDLDYDYSRESIRAFAAAKGLGSVPALNELLTLHYNSWVNWRSMRVSEYAAKVGEAVRKAGNEDVEYSAEMQGKRVFNFNDVALSGQEVSLLAPSFDFLVPMLEVSATLDDRELIERSIASFRIKAGEKPLIMRVMVPSKGRTVSPEYLSGVLGALSRGGDGMGFSSYQAVFGSQRGGRSIDEGNLDAINRVFGGAGLKPFVMPHQPGTLTFFGIPVLPGVFTLMMAVVLNMVAMPVFGRKTLESGSEGMMYREPESDSGWREIGARTHAGLLDGPSAEQVCSMLRSYDARGVHQNRIILVLDTISRPGTPMPRLYEVVSGSREWKSLALKYLHEVCLLGYAEIDDRSVTLTSDGRAMLEGARKEGFDAAFWSFMEERLHETVLVKCPNCGSENVTSFYWQTYECAGCRKVQSLGASGVVAVRTPGGSVYGIDAIHTHEASSL